MKLLSINSGFSREFSKNKELFFKTPTFIEQASNHHFFSDNFSDIGLTLENSSIIYYGIDKEQLQPLVQLFSYNSTNDSYTSVPSSGEDYFPNFIQELQKEILQLKADN